MQDGTASSPLQALPSLQDGTAFLALANTVTNTNATASGVAEEDLQLAFDLFELKLGVSPCFLVPPCRTAARTARLGCAGERLTWQNRPEVNVRLPGDDK